MNISLLITLALVLFSNAISRIQHVTLTEKKIIQTVDKPSEVATVAEKEEQKRIREILVNIAKKYGSIKRFQAKIHSYEYDFVFGVERRGSGTLYFDNAGNTRLDVYPLNKDFVSKRKSRDGKTYESSSVIPSTWIWRVKEWIVFAHDQKLAQIYRPTEKSSKGGLVLFNLSEILKPRCPWFPSCNINAPFAKTPQLIAKNFQKRFRISVELENESTIRLKFIPTTRLDAANCRQIRIIVDKKTMMVTAQQTLGPSSDDGRVCTVTDIKINDEFPLHASRLYPEKTKYRDYKINKMFPDSTIDISKENDKKQTTSQDINISPSPTRNKQLADKKEQRKILEIIKRIAKKYGGMKRFQAKIHMFQFDSVFRVEKRGTGMLYFDALGNTRLDFYPLKKEFVSKRRTSDGKAYGSENVQRRKTTIWRKDEVVYFIHEDKIVGKMGLVTNKAYQDFKDAKIIKYNFSNRHYFPLYFVNLPSKHLPKLTPEVILERFQISIDSNSDSSVKLKIVPTTKFDSANFKTMRVIVDKKTMMITAQQMLDPTGNLETAYKFSDFKFDNEFPLHADRLYPELSKYRDYKILIIPSMYPIIVPEGKDKKNNNAKPKK